MITTYTENPIVSKHICLYNLELETLKNKKKLKLKRKLFPLPEFEFR